MPQLLTEPESREIVSRITEAIHALGGIVTVMVIDSSAPDLLLLTAEINSIPVHVGLPRGTWSYGEIARTMLNALTLPPDKTAMLKFPHPDFLDRMKVRH